MVLKALFMVPAVSDLSFVNGWQPGPVLSPGYVRWSEDRLCEPHFQRSTALSDVRVYGQDYLGAGIFPLRNQDKG